MHRQHSRFVEVAVGKVNVFDVDRYYKDRGFGDKP